MADLYTEDATYGWNVGPNDEFMVVGRERDPRDRPRPRDGRASTAGPTRTRRCSSTTRRARSSACGSRWPTPRGPTARHYEIAGLGGSWFRYGGNFQWSWQRDFFDVGNAGAALHGDDQATARSSRACSSAWSAPCRASGCPATTGSARRRSACGRCPRARRAGRPGRGGRRARPGRRGRAVPGAERRGERGGPRHEDSAQREGRARSPTRPRRSTAPPARATLGAGGRLHEGALAEGGRHELAPVVPVDDEGAAPDQAAGRARPAHAPAVALRVDDPYARGDDGDVVDVGPAARDGAVVEDHPVPPDRLAQAACPPAPRPGPRRASGSVDGRARPPARPPAPGRARTGAAGARRPAAAAARTRPGPTRRDARRRCRRPDPSPPSALLDGVNGRGRSVRVTVVPVIGRLTAARRVLLAAAAAALLTASCAALRRVAPGPARRRRTTAATSSTTTTTSTTTPPRSRRSRRSRGRRATAASSAARSWCRSTTRTRGGRRSRSRWRGTRRRIPAARIGSLVIDPGGPGVSGHRRHGQRAQRRSRRSCSTTSTSCCSTPGAWSAATR